MAEPTPEPRSGSLATRIQQKQKEVAQQEAQKEIAAKFREAGERRKFLEETGVIMRHSGAGDAITIPAPDPDNSRRMLGYNPFLSEKVDAGQIISFGDMHFLTQEPARTATPEKFDPETTYSKILTQDEYQGEIAKGTVELSVRKGNLPLSQNPQNNPLRTKG
jgi:hypothetical protein